MIRSGRGWGKNATGSHFVHERALAQKGEYAVFGRTAKELRENMLLGESGLIACAQTQWEPVQVDYDIRDAILTYPNGSRIYGFSAETPDAIRGKNLSGIWYDEFASYQYAQQVWDNSQLALRKGNAWTLITTTPNGKTSKLIRQIEAEPDTHVTVGTSYENLDNLSPAFRKIIKEREGTRLGREEINAEVLDESGALFNPSWFKRPPVAIDLESLDRIVVAMDPATGSLTKDAGEHGIVVAGRRGDEIYILDDCSLKATPEKAARAVVAAYEHFKADRVIVEKNNGGEWIPTVLRSVNAFVPVETVHAMIGKRLRAEPIAAMYERGQVFHCKYFKELEDQMVDFDPDRPRPKNSSPDRLDGLVWACTALIDIERHPPTMIFTGRF